MDLLALAINLALAVNSWLAIEPAVAINTGPFRYLRFLLIPVVAIAVIALGIYLARHRQGKNRT